MRALLVVNPQATSITRATDDGLRHALATELDLVVEHTRYRGHAMELAMTAAERGIRTVIAHGGDGTVSEVVNGLLAGGVRPGVPRLGIIPGGAANVFARALGLPRDPRQAVTTLLGHARRGDLRTIGLGRIAPEGHKTRYFTFNAGLGWDAAAVAKVERSRTARAARRRTSGASDLAYLCAAVTSYPLPTPGRPRLLLRVPGRPPITAVTAFVANTDPWTYLGDRAVRTNPGCRFDGGLGLFALRRSDPLTVARAISSVLRAGGRAGAAAGIPGLVRDDDLDEVRAEVVGGTGDIDLQVDGDHVGRCGAAGFESVPAALTVLAGSPGASTGSRLI